MSQQIMGAVHLIVLDFRDPDIKPRVLKESGLCAGQRAG
jgi:hypothetical protein